VWPAIGLLVITLVIDVVDFADVFWRSAPDPTWDTRWRSLDPTESTWLAYMATSRNWLATLTDPEEIALARGFRRHERRYIVYADLAVVPFVVAAAVLMLAGLVSIGVAGLVAFIFTTARSGVLYLRERRIKKTYEQAKADYRGMTGADPAPAR
jgi:Flp pilus assembly protein TadB